MPANQHLFDLIRSLSRNEKGYIRKQVRVHGGDETRNTMKLFDLIDRQQVYDEEAVRHAFKNTTVAKHLPEAKYYLQKQIMKCLQQYHSSLTVDMKLLGYLQQIDILSSRALYDLSLATCRKARSLAKKHEKYRFMLSILHMERDIYWNQQANKNVQALFLETYQEEAKVLEALQEHHRLSRSAQSNYNAFKVHGQGWSKADKERMEEHVPLLKKLQTKGSASFDISREIHHGLHTYFWMNKDLVKALDIIATSVKQYQENSDRFTDRLFLKNYLILLNQYAFVSAKLGKWEVMDKALKDMESLRSTLTKKQLTRDVINLLNQFYYVNKTNAFLQRRAFKEGVKFIRSDEARTYLNHMEGNIDRSFAVVLKMNIASLYMGNRQYKEALPWNYEVVNGNYGRLRGDLYVLARVFQLVIHYEIGNEDLLQSLVNSTRNYLRNRKRTLKFESCVLEHLSIFSPTLDPTERQKQFKALRKKLAPLAKDEFERVAFEDFDFLGWIDEHTAYSKSNSRSK
ncbi:MAG: hypothetical protein H6585_11590 [Flavobacteriales bacterium]|nr:hypothetical protein [Flavobacteriales bacterium]MCB9448976.1 hypothetical protein [Flavobacteriales bacterium]